MPRASAKQLFQQRRSLQESVAYSFKALVFDLLFTHFNDFVVGAEFATVDCGLYIGSDDLPPNDEIGRLHYVTTSNQNQESMLLLDCKIATEVFHAGNYTFSFTPEITEQVVEAYIVGTPFKPGFVALIPRWHLQKSLVRQKTFSSTAFAFDHTAPPAFAVEWSALVMPLKNLPKAIDSFRRFHLGETNHYENPYNKIEFIFPRPKTQPAFYLLPRDNIVSAVNNHYIRDIWQAFNKHSSTFKVVPLRIRHSHGHFMFQHLDSGTKVVVELKNNYCWTDASESTLFFPGGQDSRVLWPKWTAQWDLVIVGLRLQPASEGPSTEALCFNRDELPQHMYENLVKGTHVWSNAGQAFLESRLVDMTFDAFFVGRLENILLSIRVKAKSRPAAPRRVATDAALGNDLPDIMNKEPDLDASFAKSGVQQVMEDNNPGTTSRSHVNYPLFEARQGDVLNRMCAQQRFGMVYHLGDHVGGRAAMAAWVWTDKEVEQYRRCGYLPRQLIELQQETLMLYLNFAHVDISHQHEPRSTEWGHFKHAIYSDSKAINILDGYTTFPPKQSHHRLLVPSHELDTKEIRARVEQCAATTMKPRGYVHFRGSKAWDSFDFNESETIPELQRILWAREKSIPWGHPHANCRISVDTFLVTQMDVVPDCTLTMWYPKSKRFAL